MAMDTDRFVRIRELCCILGVSRATIYRLLADGTDPLPQQLQIHTGTVGWWLSTILEWARRRPVAKYCPRRKSTSKKNKPTRDPVIPN